MSLKRFKEALANGATLSAASSNAVLMKGGGGSTTTVQNADPWAGQQPYLRDLFRRAKQNVAQPKQLYGGQTVADQADATLAGQQSVIQGANTAQGQLPSVNNALSFALNATDVNNNPHLAAAAAGAIRPVQQQLQENILPNIGSAAQQSGAYGGGRQGIIESNAVRDATRAMTDITARLYSDAYGQGLDAQGRALALAPSILQAQAIPGQLLDAVGQQQQAYQQSLINDAVYKHDFLQNEPDIRLANYQNLITGGYGGTSTSSISGGNRGGFGPAIGGALSGYSLGSGAVSTLGLTGGLATALPWVGAAAGLASLF